MGSVPILRLGTRGSQLALAQAHWVRRRLEESAPGLDVELVVIKTAGDRLQTETGLPLPSGDPVKGLFVKEIEEALLRGEIDGAVHSAKDLPAGLPEGLAIVAYPEREDPRDVFIGRVGRKPLKDLPPGAILGSSSLRRQLQVQAAFPQIGFLPMRGNLDTRLRKLEEGQCQGLVVALAGLKRLEKEDLVGEALDPELVLPAPAQGALALEARANRPEVIQILGQLDDSKTRIAVECERSFLRAMGGGCQTPMGALAELEGNWLRLRVFWSDMEGAKPVRLSGRSKAEPAKIEELVRSLSESIHQISNVQ